MDPALRALVVTLAIEVPLVILCYPGQRLRLALVALGANGLTNLTVNLVLPWVSWVSVHWLLMGEISAWLLEAMAYAAADKRRHWAYALAVSAVGNLLSFKLGGTVAHWMHLVSMCLYNTQNSKLGLVLL